MTEPPAISRKIVPPHWFFFFLAVEIALHYWLPVTHWIPPVVRYAGSVLIALGLASAISAVVLFRRAKTGLVPFSESTSLVVAGPYRFTRNPMYLGLVLVLLGTAVLLGSATPFLGPPAFMVVITYLFIRPEEAHMERAFGSSYLDLKRRVRRWI